MREVMGNDVKKPLVLKILLAFMWSVLILGPVLNVILAGAMDVFALSECHSRGAILSLVIEFGIFIVAIIMMLIYSVMLVALGHGRDWARKSLFRCNLLNALVCFLCCLCCFGFGNDFILELLGGVHVKEAIGMGVGFCVMAISVAILLMPSVRRWCENYVGGRVGMCKGMHGAVVRILLSVFDIAFSLVFVASCAQCVELLCG